MNDPLTVILSHLDCNPGAIQETLDKLQRDLLLTLPEDYLQFLRIADGAEGFYGDGYWAFHNADEVPELTRLAGAEEFTPGLVIIASNGGGGIYGIDTRCRVSSEMEYVELALMGGMNWDEVFYRAKSLVDLFEHYKTDEPTP